jgi:release factor glutamine methyltransferase
LLERRTTRAPATPASIYPPREDTALLRPFARAGRGGWLADVGTGSGALALAAARAGDRVVATDRNPAALAALHRTATADRLRIAVVRTDLLSGLRRFDRIVANPPYLPTPPRSRDPDPWVNLALDGGPDGCRVTARFLARLPHHLRPGGRAFLLVSSLQSADRLKSLRDRWVRRGGRVRSVARRALEGEVLAVWELRPPTPGSRATAAPTRGGRSTRGTSSRSRAPRTGAA